MPKPDPREILQAGMKKLVNFQKLEETAFERTCVETILTTLNLTHKKTELLRRRRSRVGISDLALLEFCDCFPRFPYVLASAVTRKLKDDSLYLFFKDFKKRPLYQKFIEAYDELPLEFRDRDFALIVKWPRIPHGLVIHTGYRANVSGTRLTYVDGRVEYVIEPLKPFLLGLKSRWQPDE